MSWLFFRVLPLTESFILRTQDQRSQCLHRVSYPACRPPRLCSAGAPLCYLFSSSLGSSTAGIVRSTRRVPRVSPSLETCLVCPQTIYGVHSPSGGKFMVRPPPLYALQSRSFTTSLSRWYRLRERPGPTYCHP